MLAPAAATVDHSMENNQLLDCLPKVNLMQWQQHLEWVYLPMGQVLYESDDTSVYVYFPTSAVVSLQCITEMGESTQIAIVGNEGIVGFASVMGGDSTCSRALVQSAGYGYRLNTQYFKRECRTSRPVMNLLLRYLQALITQTTQTAVCNRYHSLSQQLCCVLLTNLDRLQGNEIRLTQDLIANILGVRREGITHNALRLQRDGIIRYARGLITVLDRNALELRSCECYDVVRREYRRLLPAKTAI